MKRSMKLGFVMAAFISLTALPAMAQDNGDGSGREQKFAEMKAKMLQRMKEKQACVEAAKDFKDLRSCRPARGGHMSGGSSDGPGKSAGSHEDGPEGNGGSEGPND